MPIAKKIISFFKKSGPMPKNPGYCEFCKTPNNFQLAFFCSACSRYYCGEHKSRESHKCNAKTGKNQPMPL
ncbi:hypothetical protein HYS31_06105 [Candidatus Woesearchaeota archaeon]|nr:hypothetical protein [Candidatus Woesearchaeota archaeon]